LKARREEQGRARLTVILERIVEGVGGRASCKQKGSWGFNVGYHLLPCFDEGVVHLRRRRKLQPPLKTHGVWWIGRGEDRRWRLDGTPLMFVKLNNNGEEVGKN